MAENLPNNSAESMRNYLRAYFNTQRSLVQNNWELFNMVRRMPRTENYNMWLRFWKFEPLVDREPGFRMDLDDAVFWLVKNMNLKESVLRTFRRFLKSMQNRGVEFVVFVSTIKYSTQY